jgi:hypothetical protein
MPFNYTGGYEYLNIKWSISMHLMVYFNASGGSKVSIDGPFEMQYSKILKNEAINIQRQFIMVS